MNIVTEITPNPETLKFKVSKNLLKSNGIEFKRVEDAQENKFIEELFGIDGVKSIFVGSNFVSITKKTQAVWGQLKAKILIFLVDYCHHFQFVFFSYLLHILIHPTCIKLFTMIKFFHKASYIFYFFGRIFSL